MICDKKNLVKDILDFSVYFKKTNFSYISRNFNGVVYCLTKFSFQQGKSLEQDESFPIWQDGFEGLFLGYTPVFCLLFVPFMFDVVCCVSPFGMKIFSLPKKKSFKTKISQKCLLNKEKKKHLHSTSPALNKFKDL